MLSWRRSERGILQESCNHSKTTFPYKMEQGGSSAGSIDGALRILKEIIAPSLATRHGNKVNTKLLKSIRVWQWRWMNSSAREVLSKTGGALQQRVSKQNTRPDAPKLGQPMHLSS